MSPEDVWRKLEGVFDPEMDQPLTSLGFIENLEIEQGEVTIYLRLPTFWCAPNFVYWMMRDIKEGVSKVPDVKSVKILLKEHFEAERLNAGIAEGKSFEELFSDESITGGLDELRRTFNQKSFISRQADLATKFTKAGIKAEEMTRLTLSDVKIDDSSEDIVISNFGGKTCITLAAHVLRAYLKKREDLGLPCTSDSPLFVSTQGDPIRPEDLMRLHERGRLINLNFASNALLCCSLLSSRYKMDNEKFRGGGV